MCGSTWQNKYLFISKSGKPLEKRLLIIRALNPRPRGNLKTYEKLAKKKVSEFKISALITSFSTSSPWSIAFTILLMTTRVFLIRVFFIKLPDRQFLIPNENKKGIKIWLIPLQGLKESWGNVRGLLGTEGDNFPRISWCHFQVVWEKETRIGYFINIMTLCKWSCCHRVILHFGKKNSARFFMFHFTHYPSY